MDENTNKDVSELTDEELDQAIESSSTSDESPEIESTEVEEPEVPEVQPEQPEEQVEEAQEEKEAPKEEKPEEPSKRENLRIRQVLQRLQQQQPQPQAPVAQGMDYRQNLDADDQTVKMLEEDRQTQANNAYQQGLSQANSIQFHTRLELDAPKVESKYSQLNPSSKDFDPAVADAINTQYLYMTGYNPDTKTATNPNLRYSEFVDATMELVERASSRKAETSTRNIAKQAASTGLRPDGSSAKRMNLNQSPDKMSDEELDAVIAQAGLSTKKRN